MASARYRGRMIVNDTDYTGSFVDPNPEGVATDDLNTVAIDGHIFNVVGSGGGGAGDITNYYGVFIDTNNIIQPFVHITDTAEHTYVATEDCAVAYYIPNDTNTDVYIKLDGIQIGGQYGQYINATSGIVYMKKGQVFSYQTTYVVSSGAGYTVYGLQSGDRIPALIQDAQIYSLEEKQVGVWIDGKPLYQKTVSFPANTSQTFSVNLGVQNVEHIFLVPDGCYGNNGTWTIPYITGTNYLNNIGGFFDNLGSGNTATFEFRLGQESAPYNQGGVLTFKYTKTTDEEGNGGYQAYGMSPVIYSTKEREIGVWIDNKPLYQKTFEKSISVTSTSRTWYTVITSSELRAINADKIFIETSDSYIEDSDGLYEVNYSSIVGNLGGLMGGVYDKTTDVVQLCIAGVSAGTKTAKITIKYTKTTDSPKRTGYELLDIQENQIIVDATRYSTEEKIIGTWIDNKPLYQKTFVISSIPSNSYDYYNFASNVDKVINYQGMVIDSPSDASMNICYVRPDNTNTQFYTQILADKRFFFRTYTSWTASAYITFYYTKTTDAVGSGGYQAYGFTPTIYSTEEREVGVWIDNKPLYQKTWVLNNEILLNSNGVTINEIDASMVEHLVSCYGNYQPLSNTKSIPILAWKYNNAWYYGTSIPAYVDTITLLYTKTTDTAGSGEYNTLGVPNVHYDGNERVVGTWFGETLYEKTINTTVTPPYLSMDLSSLNINEVVGFEGCSKSSGGDSIPFGYSVASGNQYLVASFEKATSTLYISLGSGLSTYNNVFLTIRYTKTS